MKTARKAIMLVLCVVLLVVASVMGTLAYLTDTEAVTNTFTVGKVYIELDEAVVDAMGNPVVGEDGKPTGERTQTPEADSQLTEGNAYHLLPGHTYVKDPTVTVLKDSEDSYVRAIVTVKNYNKLTEAITADKYYQTNGDKKFFSLQMLTMDKYGEGAKMTWDQNEWDCVGFKISGSDAEYEFRYVGAKANDKDVVVKNTEENTVLPALFGKITVPGEIDNGHLAHLADVKIIVTAHAIQADGFTDAADAWNHFSTT